MHQPRPENPFVHPRLEARDIAFSQPLQWLALAWRDLERCPLVGGVHGLILAVAGGLFSWLYHDHYWWIVALIASCMMIAPLLAVGMYQVSRMLERGEEPTLADAMRVWLCGDLRLVQFGALLALCSLGWLITSALLVHWMMPATVERPLDFLRLVVLQKQFGAFEVWMLLSGFMASQVFASSVVTIPLLLDHPRLGLWQAVGTSWRVVAKNPVAMGMWAMLLCLFTLLGVGSAFLGLLFVVPMLGHASWHAYRDLVAQEEPTP
ncbi:MAG: DUF2189 domain-containing protein [Limnohabitans sp.]|jgi:uncharacterized membrane protein|nr:DUF2189 domain-containing protein [Limnohabitans sp.]